MEIAGRELEKELVVSAAVFVGLFLFVLVGALWHKSWYAGGGAAIFFIIGAVVSAIAWFDGAHTEKCVEIRKKFGMSGSKAAEFMKECAPCFKDMATSRKCKAMRHMHEFGCFAAETTYPPGMPSNKIDDECEARMVEAGEDISAWQKAS